MKSLLTVVLSFAITFSSSASKDLKLNKFLSVKDGFINRGIYVGIKNILDSELTIGFENFEFGILGYDIGYPHGPKPYMPGFAIKIGGEFLNALGISAYFELFPTIPIVLYSHTLGGTSGFKYKRFQASAGFEYQRSFCNEDDCIEDTIIYISEYKAYFGIRYKILNEEGLGLYFIGEYALNRVRYGVGPPPHERYNVHYFTAGIRFIGNIAGRSNIVFDIATSFYIPWKSMEKIFCSVEYEYGMECEFHYPIDTFYFKDLPVPYFFFNLGYYFQFE